MTVAEMVRSERRFQGMSQRELARRAGVSQGTVSAVERGRMSPSLPCLARIAQALGKEVMVELLRPEEASAVELIRELERLRQVVEMFHNVLDTLATHGQIMNGAPWRTAWDRIRDAGQFPYVHCKLVVTVNDHHDNSLLGTINRAAAEAEMVAKAPKEAEK